jgi:hypothetical protein
MSGIVIVEPVTITAAMIQATDVSEDSSSAWSSSDTYVEGDQRHSTTTHKLYEALDPSVSADVTISNGLGSLPGVVSWASHGLSANDPVVFATTGALPAGLTAGTLYYVKTPTADTFTVSATAGGAAINTSDAGSGNHTATGNLNRNQDPTDEETHGVYWIEVSPTNKFKLFDNSNTTRTAKATSFYYEVLPGVAFDAVYLGGIIGATSARVRIYEAAAPSVAIYDQTTSFTTINTRGGGAQAVHASVPGSATAFVRIDMAGGADLAVGVLLIGDGNTFGLNVLVGARASLRDYSRKETNEFGEFTELVERAYARKLNCTLHLERNEVDSLFDFLTGIRATAALFIVFSPLTCTVIWGFYKNFDITIAYDKYNECALELESLV